jgi:hypothetical protein
MIVMMLVSEDMGFDGGVFHAGGRGENNKERRAGERVDTFFIV